MEHVKPEEIKSLKDMKSIPSDYIEWLQTYGWGTIGSSSYMLYSGLIPLKEIDDIAPAGFLSFGDDFSGFNACFSNTGDGLVYEWDSATSEIHCTGKSFVQFISHYRNAL